ncbi:hypothetical protein G6F56_003136 [Rhizopus delemar]|uniref:BHLH domain-containing protein n=1 Tax=Rhizopus stolonifer TaxID=4846 RepID=A0A367KT10_RHIST|nr:hypothetical protein G6F56_003136 [Rhizopus delemar]RCI05343.1 hypothetical protein CU098_011754 [Rhizopus stolonifer]
MSQDNLFSQSFQSQPHQMFDPNPGLYQSDLPLQFASSVPRLPQPHLSMDYQPSSYQSPDSMIPCMQNYPNSPFERPESLMSAGGTGRPLQTKAERRAEHNATERARRENLNAKFQQLAHILPNLQNDNRHSKVTIIDRTLDYVKESVIKEDQMKNRVRELEKINSILLSQLDNRSCKRKKSIQMDPLSPSVPPTSPSSARSEEPSRVKEIAGNFNSKTMVEQPPLITFDKQTIGYIPTQVPSHCSVSPPSATVTPRTSHHVNNWPNSNNRFQSTNNHQKQEQMPYYDFDQLYTIMPGTHLNYQHEKDMKPSRFVEQQRYIPMTIMDQSQPNTNFYNKTQRQ